MAVTEVTPTTLTANTAVLSTMASGTAINTGNTIEIPYPKQGKVLIQIVSSHSDTAATFTAGYGVASKATTIAAANGVQVVSVIDSDSNLVATGAGASTFKGCLQITWAANSAGYLRAWYLP